MKLKLNRFGSGSALVLIHGMGSASTAWKPLIPALSKKFEVITLDLPGHGDTPLSASQAMDPNSLGKLVFKNLKDEGINRFHLVGNSLGGWIGLEMSADFPDAVISYVGLAPAGLWLTPFTSKFPAEFMVRGLAKTLVKPAPSLLKYKFGKQIGFESVSPRWQELDYEICLDAVQAMAKADGYFPVWNGMLHKRFERNISTDIPVTIIFGDSDRSLPAKTCQERTLSPDHSKWVILPSSGHAPMWDSTQEVLAEIFETTSQVNSKN